jgi:hypothetical protein
VNRVLVALLVMLAAAPFARAEDSAPTPDQVDAAKKAFNEGKALYDAGKLPEALDRFKESYRLSRNPFLLYNIAHTYDQSGDKAKALYYYQKFLATAPADAAPRDDASKRAASLAAEQIAPDGSDDAPAAPAAPKIELAHKVIDAVPPGLPCDITATVAGDATGLAVTLFYRGAGEETFASAPMSKRGDDLVARVPADKILGTSFQYYIDVRDAAGKIVARSGKPAVPNLVAIDASASAHYTPEPGEQQIAPLPRPMPAGELHAEGASVPWRELLQPKWIATSAAGLLLGATVFTFVMARDRHSDLVNDASSCGSPPCRSFDPSYDQVVESSGVRYNTLYQVSLGLTVAAIGVAGYLWYRDVTHPKQRSWSMAPTVGDRFRGLAAGTRF